MQMYKVYRDPEGNSVEIRIVSTDQHQQPKNSFQYSEEIYKSQIQKLNGEVVMLQKKV